jgi:aspartate-semialdehyde dehydrogenase
MKLAIIGATGLVGKTLLTLLQERNFNYQELFLVASEASVGEQLVYNQITYELITLKQALAAEPTVAIFSAGSELSLNWAPKFTALGTKVIDNSEAWRLDPGCKLIVPEINGHLLTSQDCLIANPNCSTIQMVMALAPLHQLYKVKRLVISTYQAVTGSGRLAVEQLLAERQHLAHIPRAYEYPIDLNVIPYIDQFYDNGYTKEESKLIHETRKILGDLSIQVTATAVRVPVLGGHAMAVNVEFAKEYVLEEVMASLSNMPGLVVQDWKKQQYPMPLLAQDQDTVFVGRIRRDESQAHTLNLWIVADNLRKGAATNAIQIVEYLQTHQLL